MVTWASIRVGSLLLLSWTATIATQHDENTEASDDAEYQKILDVLKLDETETSGYAVPDITTDSGLSTNDAKTGEKVDDEEESDRLIWIIIAILLMTFVFLGVFNHVIIPLFCIERKGKKDKNEIEPVIKMSEIEKEEKKTDDSSTDIETNKEGTEKESFKDAAIATTNNDIERIESIENENFDNSVLKVVSTSEVSPRAKKAKLSDNEEYTNTPRNSLAVVKDNENPIADSGFRNEDEFKEKLETKLEQEVEEKISPKEESSDNSTPTPAPIEVKKEEFRSRKKSSISIEIEDGNIKNFVEGPPGGRISTIAETNQE